MSCLFHVLFGLNGLKNRKVVLDEIEGGQGVET